jgi:type VI secretion system protein ImpC
MGEVWEARGPGGVPTALKRVPVAERCGRRELEALQLLMRVRHPHLLAIHGYWVAGSYLVIGLELAGQSLRALLQERRQSGAAGLPAEAVLRYLADAAEALDYLGRPVHRLNSHTVRIQHRDVKPANLLLQGGAVKVADFGLAKALEGVAPQRSFSMTLAYAPPEFFRGETKPTSDQYSLGVTYYELRTGRLPFAGAPEAVMQGHLAGEPDLTGLTERERAVVARALAKDPDLRWAGCVKFIGEIARAGQVAGGPVSSSPDAAGPPELPQGPVPAAETAPHPATFRGQPVTTGLLLAADDLVPIPLKRTDVRAAVTAACADVTVTQVFVNTHPRALEATYVFPLPEDAAVHGLRMFVGERLIEGVVHEKEEARATYEEAKQQGHGAALVEQTSPNIFTTSVANLLPGQEIRVEIRYLQPLTFQEGRYRFVFPMVVSPRYVLGSDPAAESLVGEASAAVAAPRLPQGFLRGDAVSLEIELDAGVPLCGFDSPSHDLVVLEESGASRVRAALRRDDEIPNRDFVLNYRVAGPQLEHVLLHEPARPDQPGTFLLIATPPLQPPGPALAREIIFVIDRSGSMSGEPLAQAVQAARQLLDRLEPDDAVNVVAFDHQVAPLAASPLPAEETNLRRARAFLERLQAGGGTEMLEPLRLALQMPPAGGRERARLVVFLTDGSVTGERELLAALRPAIGRTRVVAFGIGTAVNRHLINKLAAAGRGFAEFLFPGENIARAVDRTLRRIGRPVLTDVELHWDGGTVEEVLPERCPDVYLDQPLAVLGRFRGAAPPGVTVRGRLAGRPYEARLDAPQGRRHEDGAPLAALWARCCIEELMDLIWEQPHREPELRRQVIGLAKRYSLASQFTSFLAVEYRTRAEREQARGVVTAAVPQYTPHGMPSSPPDLVQQVVGATRPQTDAEKEQAKEYFLEFLGSVKPEHVIPKDVEANIKYWIGEIDKKLSAQLNEVMHHPDFQRLEGAWRGLHHLVHEPESDEGLKIKVLNVSKRELAADLENAVEFDQSTLFKKVYEEFTQLVCEPYGVLIGDYEFAHDPEDVGLLERMARVVAEAFCPFIAAASPKLLGLESWTGLVGRNGLATAFDGVEYTRWGVFRENVVSRFVALTLPRVLGRAPYGEGFKKLDEFGFEEVAHDESGKAGPTAHALCWMNAAYVLGARLADAYAKDGSCLAIQGAEGGGKADGLAGHPALDDDGAPVPRCPTEVVVAEARDAELRRLGLLPLCRPKGADFVAFLGAETAHQPADAGAAALAQLPCVLQAARFAHYLKIMARDRLRASTDVNDCERWLNRWLNNYVAADPPGGGPEARATTPLAEAHVQVQEAPGEPGRFTIIARLRPFLASGDAPLVRMVLRVPKWA